MMAGILVMAATGVAFVGGGTSGRTVEGAPTAPVGTAAEQGSIAVPPFVNMIRDGALELLQDLVAIREERVQLGEAVGVRLRLRQEPEQRGLRSGAISRARTHVDEHVIAETVSGLECDRALGPAPHRQSRRMRSKRGGSPSPYSSG